MIKETNFKKLNPDAVRENIIKQAQNAPEDHSVYVAVIDTDAAEIEETGQNMDPKARCMLFVAAARLCGFSDEDMEQIEKIAKVQLKVMKLSRPDKDDKKDEGPVKSDPLMKVLEAILGQCDCPSCKKEREAK